MAAVAVEKSLVQRLARAAPAAARRFHKAASVHVTAARAWAASLKDSALSVIAPAPAESPAPAPLRSLEAQAQARDVAPGAEIARLATLAELLGPPGDGRGHWKPCRSLGGLSPVAFQALYGDQIAGLQRTVRASAAAVEQRLRDDNEYLEETHTYLAMFIEEQKDRIAALERELDEVRRAQQLQLDLL